MKSIDEVPIVCSLKTAELRDRKATLLAQFRSAVLEAEDLQEGYALHLSGDGSSIGLIAELIVAERECCPFLAFELAALPNNGPAIVKVTGTAGAKEFVRTILNHDGWNMQAIVGGVEHQTPPPPRRLGSGEPKRTNALTLDCSPEHML
jgi:hypothetical protein